MGTANNCGGADLKERDPKKVEIGAAGHRSERILLFAIGASNVRNRFSECFSWLGAQK